MLAVMAAASRNEEANSRWEAIIASAVDGIVVIDGAGRIEAFNPAAERLFGYREDEILGENVRLLMPAPYRDEHDSYIANYLATGAAKVIGSGREVVGKRRDGTTFPMHLSVGEMVVDGERKFTGIIHDLSERVRIEEQLREQTALARLGEMAAVVAHEVKNPLTAIRASVQTLGGRLPMDDRGREVVQQIVGRIDALSDLMQELLLFARPPRPRVATVDVVALVESTAEFLKNDPALVAVDIIVSGDRTPIAADPELLRIAFLNVLLNAAQAMKGEGRVEVECRMAESTCTITMQDNGPGIPPDVRNKVFAPFFTTKRRGTGLGLPTARRLIEGHGGAIALECPHAGGARVTVTLPSGPRLSPSAASAYTR